MKGTRTTNILSVFSIIAAVALAALVFLFLHIQNKVQIAIAIQEETVTISEQNKQFANLSDVLKDVEADREKLNSYFVESNKIVGFLETIESLSEISGADIEVRTITELDDEDKQESELSLNVTAEGSWASVYHFLSLIENIPVRLVLDQARFQPVSGGSSGAVEGEEAQWASAYTFRVLLTES